MVAEQIYGSEVKQDNYCPHCGSHRQHHATVAEARGVLQVCPACRYECRVWLDKHGTPTYTGCRHVVRTVLVDGEPRLEFRVKELGYNHTLEAGVALTVS
jgi:hypothetical protein